MNQHEAMVKNAFKKVLEELKTDENLNQIKNLYSEWLMSLYHIDIFEPHDQLSDIDEQSNSEVETQDKKKEAR